MLFLFDLDGTLIKSFLRAGAPREHYDKVELLPGRLYRIDELTGLFPEARFGIVTNQAGVAMGYQKPAQVRDKIGRAAAALNFFGGRPLSVHAAFEHPDAKLPAYKSAEATHRKPAPGMLLDAMANHGVKRNATVMVGDMETDRQAANRARVLYADAGDFFS